jgi:thiamine pyrophosphokinase
MRVVIFVNGEFHEPQFVKELLRPEDYIIAVNGGTRHALSIGVVPQAIIGDLDSFTRKNRRISTLTRRESSASLLVRMKLI